MNLLRVTHLSRHRDNWPAELGYDGWFLRFSGDDEAFDDMRDGLKAEGRMYARWMSDYAWNDGKHGAWWVDDGLLTDIAYRFSNLDTALTAVRDGQTQWIAPRRASRKYSPPTRQIPAHLRQEYALLQIGPDATTQEAKDAYRRLSKVHHPDTGGTHLGFIALQHAYAQVKRWLEHIERIAV